MAWLVFLRIVTSELVFLRIFELLFFFFFSSRRRHTRYIGDWSSDVCSSDLDRRTLHVDTETGEVFDESQKPRLLLRIANWLHLNRGKKAWSYFADGYAAGLLLDRKSVV